MPAAIDSFDDVLSTISSNKLDEAAKTFSIGDGSVDMQINFTSLFSLLGLAEDGTICRGGKMSGRRGSMLSPIVMFFLNIITSNIH